MILSRFFVPVRLLNRYVFSNFYSREGRPQPSKLQFQILESKSFNEFYRVFDQNRSEFTPEMYSFCSKTLSNVIYKTRDYINSQQAFDFLKSLQSVDINQLNQRNIINILTILRSFKLKRLNIFPFNNFKNLIADKLGELYKAKTIKPEDLGELINAHYELSFFKNTYACKTVVDKIYVLLGEGKATNQIRIAPNQLTFFFHSLSMKTEMTKTQNKIRSILLQKVKKQFEGMRIEDIVNIACSLNRMDILDFQTSEFVLFKNITKKIVESITDLDQKSVFSLIKTQFNSKFPGFLRIYQEIIHSIFAEIKDNGQSNIHSDSIFKVLHYLSSKIDINKTGQKEHLKLLAFLQRHAKQVQASSKKDSFAYHVDEMVKNDFFDKNQKKQLLDIFQKYELPPTLNLIYYMSIKNYSIEQFVPYLLTLQVDKLKNLQKYRLSIIINLLKSQNKEILDIGEKISNSIAENYFTPEKFIQFYKQIKREKENLHFIYFHEANSALFSRLPNPFETNSDSILYRQSYLDYISLFLRSRDYTAFIQKYQAQIKIEQVISLIKHHLQYDNQRKLEPQLQLISLLYRRFNTIFESKNKKYVEVILDLVNKYNKFVLYRAMSHGAESNLFKVIHLLINQSEALKEMELFTFFGTILQKYITRNYHNYNIEQNYRNLLKHLIVKLPEFVGKTHICKYVIEESLRLNILTKQHLQRIDISSIPLPFFIKLQANYLKDSKFLPTINLLNQNSLKVVFQNHNFENYIKENEAKILDLVQKSNIYDLQRYAIGFNQPKNQSSLKILNQILKKIAAKQDNLEKIDIIGVIRCALEKNYYFLSGYKQIAEKTINLIKQKIGLFSAETHIELIRFLTSQPGIKTQDYYSALVKWVDESKDLYESVRQNIFTKLVFSNYEFKDSQIKLASNMIKRNPFQGMVYFLMLQNKFEASQRSALVKQICENIPKSLIPDEKKIDGEEKIKSFPKIFYTYLKSKYPQQTESFTVGDENLSEYIFSEKPKTINLLQQIAKITQNEIQQIKNFGESNYILRIKNVVFVYLLGRKSGAIHEHQFFKRFIPQILGQSVTVVCIGKGGSYYTFESINQQCEGFLTVQQVVQLKGKISERRAKYQQQAVQEEEQI